MSGKRESEVVVVGAGPVGLVAAMTLKTAGIDVHIYDAGGRTSAHSYALVLHAATLRLLDRFGLAAGCVAAGRLVNRITLYEGVVRRGELDLTKLPGPYPYVVVLPQARLESLLETALEKLGVKVQWNQRVQGLEPSAERVAITIAKLDKASAGYPVAHTEVVVDKLVETGARYVIAADGYDSFVRRTLGINYHDQGPGQMYSVFQFESGGDVPTDGRLMIENDRVGAYWPLTDGRCRFSFPISNESEHHPEAARLHELLAARAPWYRGEAGRIEWTALALFERKLAASFGGGRIWMAGDAAHLTGPLGAQSMNVGLREADDLAGRLVRILRAKASAGLLDEYGPSRLAEWHTLFGGELPAGSMRSRLLPCLPASGEDLSLLLGQALRRVRPLEPAHRRGVDVVVLVAILAAAALVRVPGLFSRSIWYDETITLLETAAGEEAPIPDRPTPARVLKSAFEGSGSLNGISKILIATDIHPPVYYWLLAGWRAGLGSSLEVARWLSLLCSLGTVAVLYVLLRSAGEPWPAVPTLLFALSTDAAHYGHEARGYALASLLLMAGVLLAIQAANRPASAKARLAAMSLCLSAACLTEYVAIFPVAAVLAWYAAGAFRVSWPRALGVPAAVVLLFAAAHRALGFHAQAGLLGGRSHQDVGFVGLAGEFKGILQSATAMFAEGPPQGGRGALLVMLFVLLTLVTVTLAVWLRDRPTGDPFGIVPLFAGLAAAPLIGVFTIDTVLGKHVYRVPRYVMLAAPGLALVATYGGTRLSGRRRLVGLATLAIIAGVQLSAVNWGEERCRGAGRGGAFYRSVARDVTDQSSSAAVAVLGVGFGRGDPWSLVYELDREILCVFLHEDSDTSKLAGELSGFHDVWILGASDGQTEGVESRLAAELLGRAGHREVPYLYRGVRSSRYRHLVAPIDPG